MSLETSRKILKVSGFLEIIDSILAVVLSVIIFIVAGNVKKAYQKN